MVFSSPIFLFIFFPFFYILYGLIPFQMRNAFVLTASIAFYLLGVGSLTIVVASLLLFNWLSALLIAYVQVRFFGKKTALFVLLSSVSVNLGPLIFFKYLKFFLHAWSDVWGGQITLVSKFPLVLPLGISFYTFHFISYLIDIYQRKISPERNLMRFGIYIFLFPHLIAGPVVRYAEIKSQLPHLRRKIVQRDAFWGLILFIVGLSKKILIADPLGTVVDSVFGTASGLSTYSAWLAAICYAFQIYFDFSGYTDMAIGMARMMGFRFPRNFNRPYASKSVTEFWQRWHMTLSRWFRDYVYIPLGGNRGVAFITYRNLFIVFILCALWHGAAYTFLIWGIGHGALIAVERAKLINFEKLRLGGFPIFLVTTMLWVPFRAMSVSQVWEHWTAMLGFNHDAPLWVDANRSLIDFKILLLLVMALGICLIRDSAFNRIKLFAFRRPLLTSIYCFILYTASCISAVERGFNPFIYFQF